MVSGTECASTRGRIHAGIGNERELWETFLGAMKLGAVLIPASTLLVRADLGDRFERGKVRHVVASAGMTEKFAEIPGDYTRIVVGPATGPWRSFSESERATSDFTPDGT